MKFLGTILAGTTLAFAPAAMAQDTSQASPEPAQAAPAPATTAQAATNATVSDAEVSQFAGAALEIEKIRKDTATTEADKPARMAAAATGAGLSPERFNAIGQAMQSDTELNKRIQTAAAAKMGAPGPATPAAKKPR